MNTAPVDIAFSPDGKALVLIGSQHIRRWDLTRNQEMPSGHELGQTMNAVALSPDGRLAVSCNWVGAVRLWDAATGKPLRVLTPPLPQKPWWIDARLAFTSDGRLLVTADGYRTTVWETATGRKLRMFDGHTMMPARSRSDSAAPTCAVGRAAPAPS